MLRAAHSLPGSNGTVGLHGGSYAGINQMFTTVAAGPGSPIKAMLAAGAGGGPPGDGGCWLGVPVSDDAPGCCCVPGCGWHCRMRLADVDAGAAAGVGLVFADDFPDHGWGVAAAEEE